MTSVAMLAALISLTVAMLGERILRIRAGRQTTKLAALTERLQVYANYGKLAALRRAEIEETLKDLHRQVSDAQAELTTLEGTATAAEAQAPMEFHCIDRVTRSDGPLWYVTVEALGQDAPRAASWTGARHYALVADTAEEARKRIQERHPSPAGFAISPALPLFLP